MKNNDKQHHVSQKRKKINSRNWLAVHAHNRNGGPMISSKRKEERTQSRQKYNIRSYLLDE